jgi:hypothetical protein
MAGDGVSLQTTLLQLGSLAKSQARSQGPTPAPNLAEQLKQLDVAPTEKVRETEKSDQDGVDPDGKQEDARRRRRREGEQPASADAAGETAGDDETEDAAGVGGLIDTKA